MKALCLLLVLLIVPVAQVSANALNELVELEKSKGLANDQHHANPKSSSIWGGHAANHYQLVLFMQNGCGVCKRFDPIFKDYVNKVGIKTIAYTLDGKGDENFPDAAIAPQNVVQEFFLNSGIAMGTPTIFMVNIYSLKAYPITNGEDEISNIHRRIVEMMEIDEKESLNE